MRFAQRTYLIIAVFLQLGSTTTAQDFVWAKTIGGTSTDFGKTVLTDASGNVYTLGYFQGTADFNPGPVTSNLTSAGGYDMFLTKFDAYGNYIWAKRVGGTGNDLSISMSMDAAFNVYITGYYTGTVDFNPGAGSYSMTAGQAEDIFLLKLDSNGNFVWVRGFTEGSLDRGYSIAFDPSQNVYLCGSFAGTVDFDPGPGVVNLTASLYDSFILKLDASGNYVWAKRFGGSYTDNTFDIAVDNSGAVYATGYYTTYTTDFDPGPAVASLPCTGVDDAFVLKWDTNGNYIWARKVGSTEDDRGVSICLDPSGNVYVAGYFSQTADFDPGIGYTGITPYGIADVFIWKLDNNGVYVWSKRIGGTGNDIPTSITTDAGGKLLISGYFSETADFDPSSGTANLTSAGDDDGYIAKMDVNGNYMWARRFGDTLLDKISYVHTDAANNYYVTGDFQGTVDFNPGTGVANITTHGGRDAFVIKMGDCMPLGHADTVSTCNSYTWNDSIYTVSGDYSKVLIAQNGCDSILTLHLSINKTYDTLNISACDSYTLNNQTYTQSGSYNQLLINSFGCDSLLTLNLTVHVSTAATLTISACESYLLNGQTYLQSGTYIQHLQNVAGCDSTLTLNLTILTGSVGQTTDTACDSYTLNGYTYTQTGIYTQILNNSVGCDSILTVDLTILQSTSSAISATACDSYTLNGQIYSQTGTYTQLVQNAAGCDSVITLSLTIHPSSVHQLSVTACDSLTLNGQTYTQSGNYVQNLFSIYGCDSIIVIQLTVNQSSSGSETVTACDSYLWNGTTYNSSGIYTAQLMNQSGCDSTATLVLTILESNATQETATACISYTWNGNTYTTSGVYTAVFANSVGCDSVVTLNLTILESTESSELVSACDSYAWNGNTYTASGTYTALFSNVAGCDSIATLVLTIHESDTIISTVSSCESYTWNNGITYNVSGTYIDTLQNSYGCDSVLVLQLTITTIPAVSASDNGDGSITASMCDTYEWIDCATNNSIVGATDSVYWPTENGDYAVIGTTNGCSDTSACVTIDYLALKKEFEGKPVVYPNPFRNELTITSSIPLSVISITDVSGKQLLIKDIHSGEVINLSGLIPGTYHMSVITERGVFNYLVVKDR